MIKTEIIVIIMVLTPLFFIIPDANGDNLVTRIIKVEDSLVGGVQDEDFLLSDTIDNLNKTMIFMSFRHVGDSNEKEVYRSWELINNTAIRFYGSNNTSADNDPISFVGYIVEFTSSSDMFSQTNNLTVAGGLSDQEFTDEFTTSVNTTQSFFQFLGQTAHHSDLTWGQEELARMRIINSTFFGYEPFDAPNSGDTIVRYQIINLNNTNVLIQRGNTTMGEGTALTTFTPPTSINGSRTMLFASHNIDGELDAESDEHSFTARINPSDEIEFDRDDAVCSGAGNCILNIRWETVTFLDGSVFVQYLEFDDTVATGSDVQQTGTVNFASTPVNFNSSMAIGTVHTPFGLGQARSSGGASGAWDRVAYTVELIDEDTVDVVTNDGQEEADIWFQVVDFLDIAEDLTLNLNDTVTVSPDDTNMAINKTETDVTDAVDFAINFSIFKSLGDIVTVGDTVVLNVTTDFITNQTDIALVTDNVFLNITKFLGDTATTGENVTISRLIPLLINASDNTVEALDTVFLLVTPTPPPVGSGGQPIPLPSGGSGGASSPVRLIGLDVDSEVIPITLGSQVPSDFLITWFGIESEGVTLENIEPTDDFLDFNSWFQYNTPELLDIESTEGFENRFPTDPRSNLHQALNNFEVIAPRNSCTGTLQAEATSVCLNPILYEVEMEFEFNVKGAKFVHIHTVQIDARTPEVCDFICQLILFIMEHWIVLSALALLFIIIVGFTKRRKRKVKTVHIIRSRDVNQLGNSKNARKFKNLRKK